MLWLPGYTLVGLSKFEGAFPLYPAGPSMPDFDSVFSSAMVLTPDEHITRNGGRAGLRTRIHRLEGERPVLLDDTTILKGLLEFESGFKV